MRATVRGTPLALAARHAMMFASSELLAAISRSALLIPASARSFGLAPLPWTTRASSCSVARSTSTSSCSTRTTSCPSCESILAVLNPTSPAPMMTVLIPSALLSLPGVEKLGPIQVLLAAADHDHVSLAQHAVAARYRAGLALRLDGEHRQAALAGEGQIREALADPLLGDFGFDQGFVLAEVDVVDDGWGGHRPGDLRSHLPLRLYDPVGPDHLQDPPVQLAHRPRNDERHPYLLQVGCGQDAGLHVLPDDDRSAIELPDVQVPQDRLVGGVCGHQVGVGEIPRDVLDELLVGIDAEHVVAKGLEGADHGGTKPPEPDYHELPAHPIAMSSSG